MVFSNPIFSGSSWTLIIFNTVFRISVTQVTQNIEWSKNSNDVKPCWSILVRRRGPARPRVSTSGKL